MKAIKKFSFLLVLALIGVYSCKKDSKDMVLLEETPGINLDFMDTSVKPNDDFFKYVNGKWLESTEIPADRTRWGSFDELRQKTDEDALAILKAAMSNEKDLQKIEVLPGSDQEKAVHLFQTVMDTETRNKQGVEPLKPSLEKIAAIKDINDLQNYIIEVEATSGTGFFGFGVGADIKNSNINAGYLGAGRLGLPDRDYYVKDDDDSKEKRQKYVDHITRMLQYLGDSEEEARVQAEQVLKFETRLAEPRLDKVDRRDARKRYNPRSISDLQSMVPAINWDNYFKGIGVQSIDTVIVTEVKYMDALQNVLTENNVSDWKAFLRWSALNNAAGYLSEELEKANWEFYSQTLRGAKEQRPAEERALQFT